MLFAHTAGGGMHTPSSVVRRAANGLLGLIGQRLEPLTELTPATAPTRLDPRTADAQGISPDVRRVLSVLRYTKASGSSYNAEAFEAGYHTITIAGRTFAGQRRPEDRLSLVPFDFTGKRVLDIGCNQGGMLFAVADRISHGVGIDFDSRLINAANRVRSFREEGHLDFYTFDLEKEELGYIEDFLPTGRADIVLLLAVCMWISNWTEVINFAARLADHMMFESNGSLEQLDEQEAYLRRTFRVVDCLSDASHDDPGQKQRKLYFCSDPLD
jgi:SAM-dependent methyltransferase